jgi:hypothetical protein
MLGVLQPLSLQKWLLQHHSMHFGVGLPECEGFDALWIAVDRLSKMWHCILCHTTIDEVRFAAYFHWEVVGCHGLPETIVWD